jgi:hypothetical protein
MPALRDLSYCPQGHLAARRVEGGYLYCAACGGAPWKAEEVPILITRVCQGHKTRSGRLLGRCKDLVEHKARELREMGRAS